MRAQRTVSLVLGGNNIAGMLQQHGRVLSGNVSFGSSMSNSDQDNNMNCWKASGVTPGTAATQFSVNHSLGRIPLTIAGQDTDNGGVIYRGTTPWTSTTVYLMCTTASASYNLILI